MAYSTLVCPPCAGVAVGGAADAVARDTGGVAGYGADGVISAAGEPPDFHGFGDSKHSGAGDVVSVGDDPLLLQSTRTRR